MSVKSGGGNPLRLAARACDCGKTQTGGQGDGTGRAGGGAECQERRGAAAGRGAAGQGGSAGAPEQRPLGPRGAPPGPALRCRPGDSFRRALPFCRPRFPPRSAAPSLCTDLSGRHSLLKPQKARVRAAEIACPPESAYWEPGRLKDAFVSVLVVFSLSFANRHVTNETCGPRGRLAGEAEPPRPPPPAPARAARGPRCCRPLGLGQRPGNGDVAAAIPPAHG